MMGHEERLYRHIFSMAESKSRLEKSLKSHNEVRIEHLLKLYFYPENSRDRGVWKRSVYSSLNKVPLLKNNKYPEFQFLYETIWVDPYEGNLLREMDRRVLFLSRRVHSFQPPEFPLDEAVVRDCYGICERYSTWLAEALSKVGSQSWVVAYDVMEHFLKDSIYVK
jgi:hypothetical protein